MKKTAVLMLILLVCAALPGLADNDGLLARFYDANTGDALRAAHESCLIHVTSKDEGDINIYMGKYCMVQEVLDPYEGIRVRTSEYDYIALDDGGFKRIIALEMEADPWQVYPNELPDDALISAEEEGDALVVTIRSQENYATDCYPDAVETKEVCVVDADTLEMRSFKALAVLPDGSEEVLQEATMEYDVEQIHAEVREAIEKHLYEEEHDTRTTTFILDDDKPCKRTYIYETPVGDGCAIMNFVECGYEYKIDQDRSIPSNEALDNDAVYYLERVVPEQ